jgi:signal transduction histidine kinase
MDAAGLQFSVECQPIADAVFVDRGMWEKIVLNLLSNAFKFTFDGEVAISLRALNGTVELQVRDTGVGIPADKLQAVFERFYQVRTNDRRGIGLGLYISKCIVQGHGGKIWAESKLREGSTFCFTLPV